MHIYGLDFTSAPGPRKPITCATCTLEDQTLNVRGFNELTDFEQFEAFLAQPGPWTAGLDFPFGQPLKLVKNLEPEKREYVDGVVELVNQALRYLTPTESPAPVSGTSGEATR